MKFSCLIAAYRADNYIEKALGSLLAQEHSDWELIVVEDGSRGKTEEMVKQFGSGLKQPVRYENLGVNRGVAEARNRLLGLAKGDALAFLDADDWWTPGHLAQAERAIAGGCDVVISPIQMFDLEHQRPLGVYAPPAVLSERPLATLFEVSAIMTSSSVALHRQIAGRAGEFDPTLRIGEDRDYWLRCAAAGARFGVTSEVTCYYAKHSGSTMARTLLWAEQEVAFYEKHFRLAPIGISERKSRLASALLNYGRLARRSDAAGSRRALRRSFALSPSIPALLQWVRSSLSSHADAS